jgi:hypothetical protein
MPYICKNDCSEKEDDYLMYCTVLKKSIEKFFDGFLLTEKKRLSLSFNAKQKKHNIRTKNSTQV